ncbi:SSI family serine proteinase inhibitor [Streptomyces sp. NPDC001941]|uniref:SSI family serine proteinase inhibitor n=1 Tax=Streptomyces sp. NPDC001941 TaxID=3154659 RepID=UPI003321E127
MRTLAGMALTSALALGGLAVAPAAHAVDQAPRAAAAGLYAPTALVLSVAPGDEESEQAVLRAVTLSCLPTAGTHPAPAAACAELASSGGDFAALATATPGRACTKEWDPVTVTVEGVWRGQRVSHTETFGNACLKNANESALYSF